MPRFRVNMELLYTQDAFVEAKDEDDAIEKVDKALSSGNLTDIEISPPEFSEHRDTGTWVAEEDEEV